MYVSIFTSKLYTVCLKSHMVVVFLSSGFLGLSFRWVLQKSMYPFYVFSPYSGIFSSSSPIQWIWDRHVNTAKRLFWWKKYHFNMVFDEQLCTFLKDIRNCSFAFNFVSFFSRNCIHIIYIHVLQHGFVMHWILCSTLSPF